LYSFFLPSAPNHTHDIKKLCRHVEEAEQAEAGVEEEEDPMIALMCEKGLAVGFRGGAGSGWMDI